MRAGEEVEHEDSVGHSEMAEERSQRFVDMLGAVTGGELGALLLVDERQHGLDHLLRECIGRERQRRGGGDLGRIDVAHWSVAARTIVPKHYLPLR